MPARYCPHGHLVPRSGPCTQCERERMAGRGTPTQRGYGTAHRQARADLGAGLPTPCGYCGRMVSSDERWVAAHVVDGQPQYGWMVAHPACNERAKVIGGSDRF